MRYLVTIFVCLFVTSCANNINFNERYANSGWQKIIIAPFNGDGADKAQIQFEHRLGTRQKIEVISSSMIHFILKEHGMLELYSDDPKSALFQLADKIDASGIIFAQVDVEEGSTLGSRVVQVSIIAKLVDVKSKSLVASSYHESNSYFDSVKSLVGIVSSESIDDFEVIFDRLSR